MAERIWAGPRMFLTLDGDEELAHRHVRTARKLVGYLLDTTSDLRPFAQMRKVLSDGSIVKIRIWRNRGVERAIVKIWSPSKKVRKLVPVGAGSLLIYPASWENAPDGFYWDEENNSIVPVGQNDFTHTTIWEWKADGTVAPWEVTQNSWHGTVLPKKYDIARVPSYLSAGYMMYATGLFGLVRGNLSDIRLNNELVATASGPVLGIGAGRQRTGMSAHAEAIKVVTEVSPGVAKVECFAFPGGSLQGSFTVSGLDRWGEGQEPTTRIRLVEFSEDGTQIAFLVSLQAATSPSKYKLGTTTAVFLANINDVPFDIDVAATLYQEAEFTAEQFTERRGVDDLAYFQGSCIYTCPICIEWDRNTLLVYTVNVDYTGERGYVEVGEGDFTPFGDENIFWGCISYLGEMYPIGYFEAPPPYKAVVYSGYDEDVWIYVKCGTAQISPRHHFYQFKYNGDPDNKAGGGGFQSPDAISEEGPSYACYVPGPGLVGSWLDAYMFVLFDCEAYWDIPEVFFFAPPPSCALTSNYECDESPTFAHSLTNGLRISPLGCAKREVVWMTTGTVTTDWRECSWEGGDISNYRVRDYNHAAHIQGAGLTRAFGTKYNEEYEPVRWSSPETLRVSVKDIVAQVMLTGTESEVLQLTVLDTGEKVVSAFSKDPDAVIEGVLTSFTPAGMLWHSTHGDIQGFTEMTQSVKNRRYLEPYSGTIKQTNRTPGV